MDTIKNYLDNMFANLPGTDQMLKLKNDILSNMEDKYNELKSTGKSENEAIGIVISEFGNIDELVSELGIKPQEKAAGVPTVSAEEVQAFISVKKSTGLLVGIGVFLCILGAALLILNSKLVEDGLIGTGLPGDVADMLGLFALLILVVPAIALFIYSGMREEKFKYLEGNFNLPAYLKATLQQEYAAYTPSYTLSVVLGVCMCVLSPAALFASSIIGKDNSTYGVAAMLFIIAVAVFIFIFFGSIREGYLKLLKTAEFSQEHQKQDKVIGAVAAIVWPLSVCIFLVSGLVYNQWRMNWIVFPVTGILFAMFAGSYSIIKGK